MAGKILPPRTDGELGRLLERGREVAGHAAAQILRRCDHAPGKLKITGRGAHSIIVVCACGAGTLALLVPARPLTKSETEAIIALARESEW